MDTKIIFGFISIFILSVGYILYFRDVFSHKTKPHAFSWLVWAILAVISFIAQIIEDAGPGAWINGASTALCLSVFLLSLKKGEKNIHPLDWASLTAALVSLFFWYLTEDPLITIIIVCVIDFFGFLPTIRKSYQKPYQESALIFFTSGLANFFAILALRNYLVVNWLYSSVLVVLNWSFVMLVLIRRKHTKNS